MKAKGTSFKRKRSQAASPRRSVAAAVLGTGKVRVPARWAWHYKTLLALRDRLLRDRKSLAGSAAQPIEPHSQDDADSATDEFDHDLALAELSAKQSALYEVEEAIKRILGGTYGVCEETGQLMPAARLRAIPWARFSVEVEERLEKKGVIRRPRVEQASSVRGTAPGGLGEGELSGEEEEAAGDESLGQVFSPPGRHLRGAKHSVRRLRRGRESEGSA